jgi:hypothetical protein
LNSSIINVPIEQPSLDEKWSEIFKVFSYLPNGEETDTKDLLAEIAKAVPFRQIYSVFFNPVASTYHCFKINLINSNVVQAEIPITDIIEKKNVQRTLHVSTHLFDHSDSSTTFVEFPIFFNASVYATMVGILEERINNLDGLSLKQCFSISKDFEDIVYLSTHNGEVFISDYVNFMFCTEETLLKEVLPNIRNTKRILLSGPNILRKGFLSNENIPEYLPFFISNNGSTGSFATRLLHSSHHLCSQHNLRPISSQVYDSLFAQCGVLREFMCNGLIKISDKFSFSNRYHQLWYFVFIVSFFKTLKRPKIPLNFFSPIAYPDIVLYASSFSKVMRITGSDLHF